MPDMLTEAAPAKINLALHVTGRRPDGFHNLESLVVFAGISDELTAVAGDGDTLSITGPFAQMLSTGQSNLVMRAVTAFRDKWPDLVPHGVALKLAKNLPVAAGIGGGSADAAAALRLMASLAEAPVAFEELAMIAGQLGADVPVCLYSQTCLISGVGENVRPVSSLPDLHLLLANPLVPIATADVFRRMTERDNRALPPLPEDRRATMLALWLSDTRNDLEPAAIALVPEVGKLRDDIARTRGCVLGRMSGSGATVFGVFGTAAEAHQAAQDIRAKWPDYWVAAAPVL